MNKIKEIIAALSFIRNDEQKRFSSVETQLHKLGEKDSLSVSEEAALNKLEIQLDESDTRIQLLDDAIATLKQI